MRWGMSQASHLNRLLDIIKSTFDWVFEHGILNHLFPLHLFAPKVFCEDLKWLSKMARNIWGWRKTRPRATIANFLYIETAQMENLKNSVIKKVSLFKQLLFTLPPRMGVWIHSWIELTYQICIQWC